MNRSLSALSIVFLAILLGACAANPAAVQTAAAATLAAETPLPSATFEPTYTAYPTYTPRPSLTPLIEYVTPTNTATPQGTPAIPTATPGVGVALPCADSLTVKVLEKPYFQAEMFNAKPEGKFLVVLMQITNHTAVPIKNIEMGSFTLHAKLEGKDLNIEPHKVSTERLTFNTFGDYRNPADSAFLPEWPVKILVVFDADPQAADWSLTFAPKADGLESECSVEIPLAVR